MATRFNGHLRSWNAERGFGFIAPASGGAELFVHVSAFVQPGGTPVAGEALSFELGRGKDGRPQAVQVRRSRAGPASGGAAGPASASALRQGLGTILLFGAGLALAVWLWGQYRASAHRRALEQAAPVAVPAASPAPGVGWRCDGRTQCSQMTSCAEATWFINHCPGTKMDGNHDGVPCEQQWCTGPGAP